MPKIEADYAQAGALTTTPLQNALEPAETAAGARSAFVIPDYRSGTMTVGVFELGPDTGKVYTRTNITSPREEIAFPLARDISAVCSDDKAIKDGAAGAWR